MFGGRQTFFFSIFKTLESCSLDQEPPEPRIQKNNKMAWTADKPINLNLTSVVKKSPKSEKS